MVTQLLTSETQPSPMYPIRVSVLLLACLLGGCAVFPQAEVPGKQSSPPAPLPVPPLANNPEAAEEPVDVPAQPGVADQEPGDLWDRVRAGFSLSHETHRQRVQQELEWYLKNPDYVERVARRASVNMFHVVEELERRGLPLEFALLPVVESAYQPFAYSHGRAAGLWQFIPGTGRLYGLTIDWWYDGRRDVRASTRAAMDYLEHLHDFFDGDWLFAIAAYNAGEGNVRDAVRRSRASDFWSLRIFRETYNYVPRLLAISALIANPEKYNMSLPDIPNAPYWEVVDISSQLDLSLAADLAGLSMEELYSLNAGHNQWATHPRGPHELLVPVEKAEAFRRRLAELPADQRVSWTRHRIRYGESLGTIARKYRTTIDTIRSANNLRGNMIRSGDYLLIPSAARGVSYTMTSEGRLASKQERLADRYGNAPLLYEVQPGDSFWTIAREHNVGIRELAGWNGLGTSSLLRPGMELKIFKQGKVSPAQLATAPDKASPARQQVRKLSYRVREGESLSHIASKFNITVADIREWNESISFKKYIHPGDRLTLYVDVTRLIN